MLNLLNFFADNGTATDGDGGGGFPQWVIFVIFGVLIVVMVLLMIIPQRKQKKRQQQMMSSLAEGSIVTTIGGIVGEVVKLDDVHIWIATGDEENKTVMQFVRQAIHSVAPAPGTPEAEELAEAEKAKENEIDEIK